MPARGIGWNYAHVAVDDATRLAHAEELADERAATATGFLERALAFYAAHGIEVQRLLTDNGRCYHSRVFAAVAAAHGVRRWYTQPYRPQTNGKAEALVKISCRTAGSTGGPTTRPPSGSPPCHASFTTTMATDRMEAWTATRRWADSGQQPRDTEQLIWSGVCQAVVISPPR